MRYYILDDLVDPHSGGPLRVEAVRTATRPGPAVAKCRRWCGYLGAPPAAAGADACEACATAWIEEGALVSSQNSRYAVTAGIPRFVEAGDAAVDGATQESFGYEWQHFDRELAEYTEEVHNYFGIVPPETFRDAVVLDAGCGMGRWARWVASQPIARLYAVDFSRAIDAAAETLRAAPQAHLLQADVCHLPFRPATMDFSYCLGVLHHLPDPDAGLRSLDTVTRGGLLLYLYYALDNRPAFHRWLLAAVTAVRQLTSRLPKAVMYVLAWLIAALIYWPLARTARLLERAGLRALAMQTPLSHYRRYSFRFMAGDAFDRFATPIEKRYSRRQIAAWLDRHGRNAAFSERTPFWVTLATPRS